MLIPNYYVYDGIYDNVALNDNCVISAAEGSDAAAVLMRTPIRSPVLNMIM